MVNAFTVFRPREPDINPTRRILDAFSSGQHFRLFRLRLLFSGYWGGSGTACYSKSPGWSWWGRKEEGNSAGVMVLTFIANLILCFALVKIVILTGWMTFARGSLVGAVTRARLCCPAHVCTAHYREAAVQAVRHQCPLLAHRHVFRRRPAGDLALAHHSQLLQATVDGLKWCFREPESPAAGLRRWGGSKRHQSPHFIRLPATEKMP